MRRNDQPISETDNQMGEPRLSGIDAPPSLPCREAVESSPSDKLGSHSGRARQPFNKRGSRRKPAQQSSNKRGSHSKPARQPTEKLLGPNQPIYALRELGSLLRARRKQLGYTQEELADGLGCSPRLIRETEQGRPTVGFERVLNHAMSLGIDLFARVRGGRLP